MAGTKGKGGGGLSVLIESTVPLYGSYFAKKVFENAPFDDDREEVEEWIVEADIFPDQGLLSALGADTLQEQLSVEEFCDGSVAVEEAVWEQSSVYREHQLAGADHWR